MTGIRSHFLLLTLLAVLAVSLGPFAAPACADGAVENGQDPPVALLDPVEAVLDDAVSLVRVLVTVLL